MKRRIKDIPAQDRPREKLLRNGAASLSDRELLAVLIGKGTRDMDVMTLASKLSKVMDRKGFGVTVEELQEFDGVGDAKAALLLAALEYARRRIKPEGVRIETSADLVPHIRHYADRKQEHLLCASVNGANELLNIRVVSIGLVDRSPAHPREVFADALMDRASAVIIAHNHPAGTLEPSPADIDITKQLKAAGTVVGISLLDHIIFNRTAYFSFMEAGRL